MNIESFYYSHPSFFVAAFCAYYDLLSDLQHNTNDQDPVISSSAYLLLVLISLAVEVLVVQSIDSPQAHSNMDQYGDGEEEREVDLRFITSLLSLTWLLLGDQRRLQLVEESLARLN